MSRHHERLRVEQQVPVVLQRHGATARPPATRAASTASASAHPPAAKPHARTPATAARSESIGGAALNTAAPLEENSGQRGEAGRGRPRAARRPAGGPRREVLSATRAPYFRTLP